MKVYFGMATTIKVSEETRDRVNELGGRTNQTADQVVSSALAEYERALFWEQYAAAATAVAADPDATAAESADRALWDAATSRDATSRG